MAYWIGVVRIWRDTRCTICGGASGTGPKREDDCPNALHDWPTPSGYIDATDEAGWRLRHQWANVKCPDCGLYGWRPREAANHGA